MHTGINAGPTAYTQVVVDGYVVSRAIVTHFNRADADTAVAVTAFSRIYIDNGTKMIRIRVFIHKLPVT